MSEEKNLTNMVREFARDCCDSDLTMEIHYTLLKERLWEIIAFAVREEREACAKVCEEKFGVERIALECAAAIRSRT